MTASDDLEERIERVPADPPAPDVPEEVVSDYDGVIVMRPALGDDLDSATSFISARKEEWRSTEPALED